jgi:PilZ domain
VSLGLSAPAAVPVELRAGDRRFYRLSQEIGMGGIRLAKAAPFEPGQPVTARFTLPGASTTSELEAEVVAVGDPSEEEGERGGAGLYFLEPAPDARAEIGAYIADRLGLPALPPGL